MNREWIIKEVKKVANAILYIVLATFLYLASF